MNRLTEKEYVNERIANIKHYIEFNEREDDKYFFAHKELELYKKAQKYIELNDELGCPLEGVFRALMNGSCGSIVIFIQNDYNEAYEKGLYKRVVIDSLARACNGNDFYFRCIDTLTYRIYNLYLKDYQKTWWLSETKED